MTSPTLRPPTLKVASYNIHKGVGLDRRRAPDRILDVLDEIDADIVALQEADMRFGTRDAVLHAHLLDEHGWKAVGVKMRSASMGWHGNAILVRKPTEVLDCEAIHLPALEPRGAVMAEVRARGVGIRVIGMHLDLSGLWRRRQTRAVMAHVAARDQAQAAAHPTVMMGDLNEWSGARGCLADLARDFAFAPTGPSFHARRPIARLDRIMVSPGLAVTDCGVHASAAARKASDHLPIWATLAVRG